MIGRCARRATLLATWGILVYATRSTAIEIDPILLVGDTVPNGARIVEIGGVAFGDGGLLASRDRIDAPPNGQAIFAHDGAATLVASAGDVAPGGGTLAQLGALAVAAEGTVVFRADVAAGLTTSSAIFARSPGQALRRVVGAGDATALGDASIFATVEQPAAAGSSIIAFHSIDSAGREGLFRLDVGGLTPIAFGTQPSPLGGLYASFGGPALADDGTVVFFASGDAGKAIFVQPRGGTPAVVVAVGESVTGGVVSAVFAPAVGGSVVALGATVDGPTGVHTAIFTSRNGQLTAIASAGDASPDGGSYASFGEPAVDADGRVAFRAVTSTGAEIMVVVDADGARTLVSSGDIGPAGPYCPTGGSTACFGDPDFGPAGSLAFRAALDDPSVTRGLFVAHLLATPGEPELHVDCDEGQTIADALPRVADDGLVTVSGHCRENITLPRSVRLEGRGRRRRATLTAADDGAPALLASAPVTVSALTVRGGTPAVRVQGAGAKLEGLRVRKALGACIEVAGSGVVDGARLARCGSDGVIVSASGAMVTGTLVLRARGRGLVVTGGGNTIVANRATRNRGTGLRVEGSGNMLQGNIAVANRAGGILVTGCNVDAGRNRGARNRGGPNVSFAPCAVYRGQAPGGAAEALNPAPATKRVIPPKLMQ